MFDMQFVSKRLIFREFTDIDFLLLYSVFSNDQIMKYALNDSCSSVEEIMPYFKSILENNVIIDNRKAYEFAVFVASTNSFIGFADIEIHNLNKFGGCAEIGYFLLPSFWGNGYATETANSLIDICFSELRLHRVSARCNSNNLQSEGVIKKVGMSKEGEFRKVRLKRGQWNNELHYSILLEDWQARQHDIKNY